MFVGHTLTCRYASCSQYGLTMICDVSGAVLHPAHIGVRPNNRHYIQHAPSLLSPLASHELLLNRGALAAATAGSHTVCLIVLTSQLSTPSARMSFYSSARRNNSTLRLLRGTRAVLSLCVGGCPGCTMTDMNCDAASTAQEGRKKGNRRNRSQPSSIDACVTN